MRIFFILYLVLILYPVFGQQTLIVLDTAKQKEYTDQLYSGLGDIPAQSRTSFFTALAHFPELKHARIELKYEKIATTMNVRPTVGSLLFKKRENRTYIIRINSSMEDSVITLNELSQDAQVGVIGHELSHIADYQHRGILGVIARGFAYLTTRGKTRYEREIDGITIKHGLGEPLYQWSYYVLYGSKATCRYKLFKSNTYMRPEEIQNASNSGQF
ncbi:MAG TPA: hypothetical protein VHO72_16700 [Bacteroidales bacterium]|nr:hypothetical protein [Bacteroidales bacterium]